MYGPKRISHVSFNALGPARLLIDSRFYAL